MAFAQRLGLQSGQLGSRAWSRYCDALARRPLATKVATGIVGTVLGDGIAQVSAAHLEGKLGSDPSASFRYDWARTSRLCAYSALLGTPVAHLWFGFLDKARFLKQGGAAAGALGKLALDQLAMAPAGIAFFFWCLARMEGHSTQQANSILAEKFKPTLMANYAVWPLANLINFALVPPEQRILYVNVVYVFWVSYLSHVAAKKPHGHHKEVTA